MVNCQKTNGGNVISGRYNVISGKMLKILRKKSFPNVNAFSYVELTLISKKEALFL